MRYLLFPEQIEPASPVGGKARALVELQQAELPIPDWCVVLPNAFRASLTPEQVAAFDGVSDADVLRRTLDGVEPTGEVVTAIADAAQRIAADGELAVRSSALEEDSSEHSFAGQLESYLFVSPEEAANAVARVWRSGFGERVFSYRREAGLSPLPSPPAVVLQKVINGDASGVAFSADPVSGRRGIAVVTAVPGLGGALVSGESDSDTWHVDRGGRIVTTNIAMKPFAQRRVPEAQDGVAAVRLSGEASTRPCVDESQVVEVAVLARRTERLFGLPQDIEWTIGDGRLYLLQSRPITGLAGRADPDGLRMIWDNSNIAESFSGMTTLTFSFARRAYEHVYRQFCRLMGLDQASIEDNADMFCCMLGLINGRVYYNLFNWYRLVAILPGYAFNRQFMEQMMGVGESLSDTTAETLAAPPTAERLRDGLRLLRTGWGLMVEFLLLDRSVRKFYDRLQETLGSARPDLARLRSEELVRYYRRLDQRLMMHWDAPIVNDFATMISHGILRRMIADWVSDAEEALVNDLLSAERGMISSEPATRVREMAELAAASPELVELLCNAGLTEIRPQLAKHSRLKSAYDTYLERFSDRCMQELKLESPTLFDDPLPLMRSIGQYARNIRAGSTRALGATEADPRQTAEARVAEAFAGHPLRRLLFARVLAWARGRVRERENLRFERTRVFGRARLIALEIGRRLAALDQLDTPRDIFWLEVDEMLAFIEGRATTTDLRQLVSLRRTEFERYRIEAPPAERFETRGVVYVGNSFQPETPHSSPSGEALQGIGCCAGRVRGPVRVIRDPRRANVAGGEIIVAERTDPGWVMIFPAAAGLLIERGSLLSHSAIVARELGLPTIVGLSGVVSWLHDGDWVEMDGATGRVARVEPPVKEKSADD